MTSPTPTPPCLGEREAVARTLRGELIARHDYDSVMRPHSWIDGFVEASDAIIAEHIEPLRTENETLRAEVAELRQLNADHEQVLTDKRRLAREIDVAMHGEEGAAKAPSLCDLIEPARTLRAERDAAIARAEEVERGAATMQARAEKAEALAKAETRNAEMYANAWVRELGGKLFRKSHHIDACVVTTRWMKERSDRLAVIEAEQKAAALVNEYGPSNEMVRARRELALTTTEHPHGD